MQVSKQKLIELHAELCGMMANAKRLAILETLHEGEQNVTDIAEAVGTPIATVSQHLRLLRDKQVVITRKDGQTVYYRLRDPRMIDACHLIRTVLVEGLKQQSDMAKKTLSPATRRKESRTR